MPPSTPMPGLPYTTADFALTVPSGWGRKALITLFDPEPSPVPNSLVITQNLEGQGLPVEEFARHQQHKLEEQLPEFKVESRQSVPSHQGKNVPVLGYSWRPPQGEPVHQVVAFFTSSKHGYTLTGTAATGLLSTLMPAFLEAARSFNAVEAG
jgi:hypothetical protein